ncbi:MAG: hypothetical protein AB8F94_14820 [Saprospiraceae bacterium]
MPKKISKVILCIGLIFIFHSCANFKLHQSVEMVVLKASLSTEEQPTHSVFLIGEASADLKNSTNPTLTLLQKHLEETNQNSTILFLGDNLGSKGMPSKQKEKSRLRAEARLDAQLSILQNFKGQSIFIPGDQDWEKHGLIGLKRQEKYIEKTLNQAIEEEDEWKNYFLPDRGCPGPEVVEVNDNLVIIIIDSHWWLMNWDEEPNVNADCEVKNREDFALVLAATIKDHRNKNIVFASHHSFKSSGPHGGKFTLKDHLFPFTTKSKNAYFPLPIVGSAYLFLRQSGMYEQDISNGEFKELKAATLQPAKANGEFIFVSGHENSLQYIQDEGQHFVVSGAGSKQTATAKNKKGLFSYGHTGFSKIDFYKDGTAWVEFWIADKKTGKGEMVFRHKMKGALPKITEKITTTNFEEYESGKSKMSVLPTTNKLSKLSNFADYMLGERWRKLYLQKYDFPMLDLTTYKGGMKVIKKGGGKQTNSLRLITPDHQEYVMRSLTKDLERGVPYPFNQLPIVNFLFNESYLGSHPFAPMVIAPLADASNIYHTNPRIFYIPKQPVLGRYNEDFGGEVYLVEERPSTSWPEADFFGNAKKFESTSDLIAKKTGNHKHRVDQNWVVRSRLFDMLVGDFDRHGDQWRWTVTKTDEGNKIYRPIPRDRDQAFSNFDGKVMQLLAPFHSLVKQLATYDEHVGDPRFNYYNGRHFDHHFMNEMSLEDWKQEAAYIQTHLTDEIISAAMTRFPIQVYEKGGKEIERILKYRRDDLQNIAVNFYKQLAKTSILHGSDKKELFEIIRLNDEETDVKMYDTNSDGDKQELLFHRIYKTSETNELYIYGLEDDDIFHITGSVKKSINLHLIGGLGKDPFKDESKVAGLSKKDKIYDNKKKNILELGTEGKDKTSKVYETNSYEYIGTHFDKSSMSPEIVLGATSSNGIIAGLGLSYKVFKFNKVPLAQEHNFLLRSSFATAGLDFTYDGIFYGAINYLDIVANAQLKGDRYSYNFFGLGNESKPALDGVDYYRVFQSLFHFDLGVQRRFAKDKVIFSLRPMIEHTDLTTDEERFINDDNNGLTDENYNAKWYGGAIVGLDFKSVDRELSPLNGFKFNNRFGWQSSFSGDKREFSTYASNLTIYRSIGVKKKVTFATKVGAKTIRGNYDFFYSPTIGEDENVRGFFGQRFRGKTNFFQTSDIRWSFGTIKNISLPFSIGITGSFDYGRIFEPNEISGKWHSSAGGALWIAPLNLVMLSVSYNKAINEDGARVRVFLGHAF